MWAFYFFNVSLVIFVAPNLQLVEQNLVLASGFAGTRTTIPQPLVEAMAVPSLLRVVLFFQRP